MARTHRIARARIINQNCGSVHSLVCQNIFQYFYLRTRGAGQNTYKSFGFLGCAHTHTRSLVTIIHAGVVEYGLLVWLCPPLSTHGNLSGRMANGGTTGLSFLRRTSGNTKNDTLLHCNDCVSVRRSRCREPHQTTRGFMYPSLRQFDYFWAGNAGNAMKGVRTHKMPPFFVHRERVASACKMESEGRTPAKCTSNA